MSRFLVWLERRRADRWLDVACARARVRDWQSLRALHVVLSDYPYEGSGLMSVWASASDAEAEAARLRSVSPTELLTYHVRPIALGTARDSALDIH